MNETLQMDIRAILKRLPHRYPFLLVDRVLECLPGKSIRALKNVTQLQHSRWRGRVGIDKARFRRPVEPGDQLTLSATLERTLRGIWKMSAVASVGEAEAASAELMLAPGTITNPSWGAGTGSAS